VPLVVALTCFATPAHAEQIVVSDPAHDGLKGRALDITGFRLANKDRAIVVTISFVRTAFGDLGVLLVDRSGAVVGSSTLTVPPETPWGCSRMPVSSGVPTSGSGGTMRGTACGSGCRLGAIRVATMG
jgi:hypothetical protein